MTFKVIIPSACGANLIPCIRSVLANEPTLPPDHIIVVDDGARVEAEPYLPSVHWLPGIRPFNYARNVNLAIREAGTDIILLDDDARLCTYQGFSMLSDLVTERPSLGVCSAGILGVVGNSNQIVGQGTEFRLEKRVLGFVCVYVSKRVQDKLGPLDERFTGYGFEDNDYCARALAADLQLGIWDGCVVDHSDELPSTFRNRSDIWILFARNWRLFREKWGALLCPPGIELAEKAAYIDERLQSATKLRLLEGKVLQLGSDRVTSWAPAGEHCLETDSSNLQ